MDSAEAAQCLERASRGDEQAAHDLFHYLYPLVFRLVRAHLPRRTSEEDLHQIAMVKVFSKASQFSGKVPLEHWVSRIVINTCLKQLRAEKVRPELRMGDLSEEQAEVLEKITSTDEAPDPHAARTSRELVDLLLARLGPDDRLLINLLHLEERSVDEVSALTGWNRTLIKVRAFRARSKLRRHLADLLFEERMP